MGMRWCIAACALGMAAAGCELGSRCGHGTVDRSGVCEVWDPNGPSQWCGTDTHFDGETQTCVPDYPRTTCDPSSTATVTGYDGNLVCVSEVGPCAYTCPETDPDRVTLCGLLVDFENGSPVGTPSFHPGVCDPSSPSSSGPCALSVSFYDAVAFAQDPSSAQPLRPGDLTVTDCGNVVAHNLPVPPSGLLAVLVDDAGPLDDYDASTVVVATRAGDWIGNESLYAVRRATDQSWTQSAGDPFAGQSFGDVGVYVPTFRWHLAPVSGVGIAGDGSTAAYFFSDAAPEQRTTVNATQTRTGVNGTALVVGTPAANYQAFGGPAGCSWPALVGPAPRGVVAIADLDGTCQ